MHFQKTTEYAIRVMAYLSMNRAERFSANRLHIDLKIPYKYLGRLMSKLSAAGLVDVTSGKSGGYQMVRDPKEIYLYQISGLVEGVEDYDRCVLGFESCSDKNPCSLHRQWTKHREDLKQFMYKTTLADLDDGGVSKF